MLHSAHMNAHQIDTQMAIEVKSERKVTNKILRIIILAEDQKAHLELGFSSLFDWLTRGHGYSEGAANRRIQAARLLRSAPQISEKLESGKTNLTNIARAQSVIRAQEKISGNLSQETKAEIVESIEGKSSFEAEQVLLGMFPDVASTVNADRKTIVDDQTVRLSQNFTNEEDKLFERVKELLSHTLPNATTSEVMVYLAKEFIKRNDPLEKKPTAVAAKRCVKVSRSVRRVTIQKAHGRCEYKDPVTGRVCGSKVRVEADHIQPRAHGGGNDSANLRCLCRAHNQFMAEKILGEDRAHRWRG